MTRFNSGQRVRHTSHGAGTIIEVRTGSNATYLNSNRGAETLSSLLMAGIGELLVEEYYDAGRYPYRVCFDSGYTDVYSDNDLLTSV